MGGCSGRPSGKKSPPYLSSLSHHAAKSKPSTSGSSNTPRPTRLTRTSLPGRRNSFGRRTAWLRPCLKILAVPGSRIFSSFDDRYKWYISFGNSCRNVCQDRPRSIGAERLDGATSHRLISGDDQRHRIVTKDGD